MSADCINKCPICGTDMSITTLGCKQCGIEIKGDFRLPQNIIYNIPLNDEELYFLKLFVKHNGNIKELQEKLGIGYYAIKSKLKILNLKLGNETEGEMAMKSNETIKNNELPSEKIIRLLNENGGSAECPMLRGKPLKIWLTREGVKNAGFPDLICEWKIFDAIVEKAKELGGKMYRGDSAAQNGEKIGSEKLPLDTIDAFISVNFYDNQIGKATTRRSTYYAAILAWAGICENKRSDGNGGYIQLLYNQ